MKTLPLGEILRRYKIDVELFDIEDTFDIENMLYKRNYILDNFDKLTDKQKQEFLEVDEQFQKFIPLIKSKYPNLFRLIKFNKYN